MVSINSCKIAKMKSNEPVPPRRSGVILGIKAMSSGVKMECKICSFNNHPLLLWGWTKAWANRSFVLKETLTQSLWGRGGSSAKRMEIMVNNRCWDDSSHTLGLWDSAEPGVESKGGTRVMLSGRAGLVERLGSGPQGTELGCLPLTLISEPEGVEGSIFKATVGPWGITICRRWHLPLPSSCCSLWTPDSASPSPKSRTSYFLHQEKKSQAVHLLTPFWPWNSSSLHLTPCSSLFSLVPSLSLSFPLSPPHLPLLLHGKFQGKGSLCSYGGKNSAWHAEGPP